MRVLATLALSSCLATGLWSTDLPTDGELLAAARSANQAYQLHLARLIEQLERPDLRVETIKALGRLQDPVALQPLLTFLEETNPNLEEQIALAIALGGSGNQVGLPVLRRLSASGDAGVRLAAYNALSTLQATTGGDHLQRAKDPDEQPHLAALANLGTIKQADAAPLLIAGLTRHPRALVRRQCAIGLGRLGDPSVGPTLQTALSDSDPGVRRYAAESIAQLDYRPAIPYLLMALDSNVATVEINQVIRRMTGQDFGFDPQADAIRRKEAVDRGFTWWTANANGG
jgi:HEAT repeat protein